MYNLWNDKIPFSMFEEMKSINGIEYINVHTAIEGEYQFLLGSAIIKYNGVFYSSWGNSWRIENDNNTILAEKCSYDGGKTWENYKRISKVEESYGRSHGVYFEHNGKLYVFCPRAKYDIVMPYPDLKTEAYVLNTKGEYEYLGIILDEDFWPMCEPIRLEEGGFVMAGLKTDSGQGAVALCDGKDITKWKIKVLPNPNNYKYWGETTVLKQGQELVAIVRGGEGSKSALVSKSIDGGKSWSGLEESNFLISQSKMYAGTLYNGMNYLVFSVEGRGLRDTLGIAIGKESFERIYIIRDGFDHPPIFREVNQWCYPYAYEDKEQNKLFVVYAKDKEDCELAIIPIESLEA